MKTLLRISTLLIATALPLWAQAQTAVIERRTVIEEPVADDLDADMDADESTGAVDPGVVDLGPEQDVIVRRRIIEERPAPVMVDIPRGPIRIGSHVPGDVPLHAMTGIGSPGLAQLAYFISPDEKIVIVEPQTRRVVRIMQRD